MSTFQEIVAEAEKTRRKTYGLVVGIQTIENGDADMMGETMCSVAEEVAFAKKDKKQKAASKTSLVNIERKQRAASIAEGVSQGKTIDEVVAELGPAKYSHLANVKELVLDVE